MFIIFSSYLFLVLPTFSFKILFAQIINLNTKICKTSYNNSWVKRRLIDPFTVKTFNPNSWSTQLLQRTTILIWRMSKLVFVLNMKVVDIFHRFLTLIFTPRSDNRIQSYGLHSEHGLKYIKSGN